eukprot:11544583-Ditylum_brightwellii.AAC.1
MPPQMQQLPQHYFNPHIQHNCWTPFSSLLMNSLRKERRKKWLAKQQSTKGQEKYFTMGSTLKKSGSDLTRQPPFQG